MENYKTIVVYVLVIIACSVVMETSAQSKKLSRCDRQSVSRMEPAMIHMIPHRCKVGSVRWHYPSGNMTIHFQPWNPHNRTMWVCVQEKKSDDMSVIDVTANHNKILPSNGQPYFAVCVPTVDGRVGLKWVAPRDMHYLAVLLYTVVKIPR